MEKKFLNYIVKMSAIAKIGLQYSKDPYALDNFEEMNNLTNEMLKDFTKVDYDRPNYFDRDVYPTPSMMCRIVIFNDNKDVILVQNKESHLWNLPGGYCNLFDTPSEAARKACKKELNSDVELVRLIGIADRGSFKLSNNIPEYVIIFEGRLLGKLAGPNSKKDSNKYSDARFFRLNDLPLLDDKTSEQEVAKYISSALGKDVFFD